MVWLRQVRDPAAGAAQGERQVVDGACLGYVEGEILQAMLLSVVKSAQDLSQGDVKQRLQVKDLSQGEA